jgi:hypothetical protein
MNGKAGPKDLPLRDGLAPSCASDEAEVQSAVAALAVHLDVERQDHAILAPFVGHRLMLEKGWEDHQLSFPSTASK